MTRTADGHADGRQPATTSSSPDQIADAAEIAHRLYGLHGRVRPLPGESDRNFQVVGADGERYVLKLHAPGVDPAELDLQDAALLHLAAQPDPPSAPRSVATLDGRSRATVDWSDGPRIARVLTWMDGRPWAEIDPTEERLWSLGRRVAEVDHALRDFVHPAMRRDLVWNLTSAPRVAELAPAVADDLRPLVTEVFERYADHVAPRLAALPHQVIHNDANELNILVGDEDVTGLIDFGDVVWSPRVCGVAVAGAYAMQPHADPLRAVLPLVRGYDSVTPLHVAELEVLFDLMRTRLAMSICLAAYQRAKDPGNDYLLVSQQGVARALRRSARTDPDLAHFMLRDAVGFEANPQARLVRRHLQSGAARPSGVLGDDTVVGGAVVAGRTDRDRPEGARLVLTRHGETSDLGVHLGCDLYTGETVTVRCPLPAVVRQAEAGSSVLLEHRTDDGVPFWTVYQHLAAHSIGPGDELAAGAPLGTINGSHLGLRLLTHLAGAEVEIVSPDEADLWTSVSLDPNLLLGHPRGGATRPRRGASALAARRRSTFSTSLSLSYREPLHIVRGEGAYLYDSSGRPWLDLVNNVCHVGHCHPRVVEAAHRQAAVLNTNTRYLHESIVELAHRLIELMPDPLRVCFFVNSGSEANDLALRLAAAHTGSQDVLVLDHAYHGHLTSQIALSPYKFHRRGGLGKPDTTHICELPDPYRGGLRAGRDSELAGGYAASVAERIDALTATGRKPAAFFAESLQSCGGQIVYPDGYLREAFEHVRRGGGVCVADEVQVGLGRVGRFFSGFELQDVVPDIVTLGKPMGNGHPIAAVVTTPEIARSFETGMEYFNTFGGNPVSAEVGLAVLDVIRDERLQAQARDRGERLLRGLRGLQQRHPLIGDVRGEGLFIGVELSLADREPATAQAAAVKEAVKARGVLISTDGPDDNVLKIKPPLVLAEADCDLFLEVLGDALAEVEALL
ncbi:aminotransferase class III-fold pyridoxal phosphate-dependent enzyme [Sinosporangium siamense]|uniref:4-aminobutyrate aminotransferase n=1 Tax=Sinosporangium siamense TaxID=1367973 RepID=A0A919RIS0_9ACTN|nr:aminotransferase class III-fold pyridoxal phosphate-dependent enzyme [Sinosporangium siamense]GII94630.1 4-aminobutyrate aminotransferase [Sinosporangium siamense]